MPRGNDIPEGTRATVVDLHKAGKGYKFISKNLGIHHSTVRKIIHKWKRFDTVATLPRSGRPTKNTPVKARRRRSQAGPADDGGGDPHEQKFSIVPEAANTDWNSSDGSEASDEDLVMCEVDLVADEPLHFIGEDPDPEMARCLFASPADVAAEDPEREEQISDANFSGEKKIYPGSSLTMGTLILRFQTFILKHDLSKAATKDLLELLNLVVPGCIPTSLEFCYVPDRRC